MFFNRFVSPMIASTDQSLAIDLYNGASGAKSTRTLKNLGRDATQRRHSRQMWRRAVTLALAVTTAVPCAGPAGFLVSVRFSSARAAEINAAAAGALDAYTANNSAADLAAARASLDQLAEPVDDAGKLAKGVAQYNAHEYEEAAATLQTVNSDQLSAQGKQTLTDTLTKASAAADQRKDARAEFEKGEQALAANQPGAAMDHYKAAAANTYADDGTVAKAKEQEAVAQDGIKKSSTDMRGLYGDAIDDYKAEKYDDAKAKFTTLQNAGFRAPLFQRSPGDYLNDIDKKIAAMPAAPSAPAAPVVAPPMAVTPPPVSTPAAPSDTSANTPAAPAVATPTTAPADNTASAQPTPVPAPVVVAAPAPPPAPDPSVYYHLARQQYNKGDWISARQNFMAARDNGYKAGLFEDSPAKYLARMDKKELADDSRHQEEIRQQQMLASAAAASAQPPAPATAEAPATQPAPGAPAAPVASTETATTLPLAVAPMPGDNGTTPVPVPVPVPAQPGGARGSRCYAASNCTSITNASPDDAKPGDSSHSNAGRPRRCGGHSACHRRGNIASHRGQRSGRRRPRDCSNHRRSTSAHHR